MLCKVPYKLIPNMTPFTHRGALHEVAQKVGIFSFFQITGELCEIRRTFTGLKRSCVQFLRNDIEYDAANKTGTTIVDHRENIVPVFSVLM